MGKIEGSVYPGECAAVFSELYSCTLPLKRDQLSEDFMVFLKKGEQTVPYSYSREQFVRFLMKSYFFLPDDNFKESLDTSADRAGVNVMKKMILEAAIPYWRVSPDEESIEVFRFFIAAHSPLALQFHRAEWESDYEEWARGKMVSKEEKDKIEALMREHIKNWRVKDLNFWIPQRFIPEEIRNILIIARARTGGIDLAWEDIDNAKFLESFDLRKQSDAAKDLAARKLKEIAEWDKEVQRLRVDFEETQRGIENSRAEETELVFNDIVIEYEKKLGAACDGWPAGTKLALCIRVILSQKANIALEDAWNIFADMKKGVIDWKEETKDLDQFRKGSWLVALEVEQKGQIVKRAIL